MMKGLHKSKHDGTGKFYSGFSDERFQFGPFDNRAQAQDEAESEREEDDPIYIGKGESAIYAEIDVHDMLERMEENLADNTYEDALEGWLEGISRAQKDELSLRLNRVFRCWLEEVGEKDCWTNISEI